jgi:Rne/Rng family ribonuclease
MLIDARHQEETRVAVVKGNRIEEFDFESAEHKQLKGNIYLAKVTRVEPSLQAAFVDYGGNRHGFLAFSESIPDYYQIPKETARPCSARKPSMPPRKSASAPPRTPSTRIATTTGTTKRARGDFRRERRCPR